MDPNIDHENNNVSMRLDSRERKLFYRELLDRVEGIQESEEVGLGTISEIGDIMRQINTVEAEHNISERYQFAEETLLDSKVLSSSSSVLVQCLKSLDVDCCTYEPTELGNKIMQHCKEDLLHLLPDALHIVPQVPGYTFMYGAYDMNSLPQPKQKKQREKREREVFQKKAPEKVTSLEKEEAGIEETVKVLYDVLTECYSQNNQQPVKYYDYVVDTTSFTSTVENMFYTAFLVREGRASIDIDGRGVPYIKPEKKSKLKGFREDGGTNSQIIAAMSCSEWKMIKKPGYIQKYKR